jgi:hypothetical protein
MLEDEDKTFIPNVGKQPRGVTAIKDQHPCWYFTS